MWGERELVHVDSGRIASVRLRVEEGTILKVSVISEVRARVSVVDGDGHAYNGMMSLRANIERPYASFSAMAMRAIIETLGCGSSSKEQQVGPLPAGTYRISATASDGRSRSRRITLRGYKTRRVTLRLK